MAEGDIGAEIDSLEFEAGAATSPKLIHVINDIYAIAYRGPDSDGWIATVSIDSAGAIPAAIEDSLEFEAGAAWAIDFIKVTTGVFAVVYYDAVSDGWIKTVTIDDAGTIALVSGGSFEFETGQCGDPSIVKVTSNIFAIAYRNASIQGIVITVAISNVGAITDPILDSLVFDTSRCVAPHIIYVTGNIFAIAYQGVDDDGWIATVDISNVGAIAATIKDSFEFDATDVEGARILQISASIYVVAYKNADSDGDMVTVSIDSAGNIGATILDDQEFDPLNGKEPCIIHTSGNFFAIAYRGVADDGFLKTWEISDAGVIAALKQDELEFDATYGAYPIILHISGNIYAIAYTSGGSGGKVISVDIETVTVGFTKHLMTMGIG